MLLLCPRKLFSSSNTVAMNDIIGDNVSNWKSLSSLNQTCYELADVGKQGSWHAPAMRIVQDRLEFESVVW
jgi:hypothetical protein